MSPKTNINLNLSNSKEKLDKFLTQAKESVKALEALQKEGLSKAKNYMHIPTKEERKRFTDDKILANLKKVGLATTDDIRELSDRIDALATEFRSQLSKLNKKESTKESKESSASKSKDTSASN